MAELDDKNPDLSYEKQFENGLNQLIVDNKTKLDLGLAKPKFYSNKVANIERYLSYGTETFGKLGFNPFANNEEKYLKGTTSGDDLSRAWTGMWKLAGTGFTDTFGFGAFKSENNAEDFESIMNKYSSNREGSAAKFWANTMLSSGYTIGIIGGIAAEELGLALTTGGIGNLASKGLKGGRILSQTRQADNLEDAVNILQDVNEARKWYQSSSMQSLKGFGKSIINPLSETTDFLRNVNKYPDLVGLKRTLAGAGALVRDARKINMTLSESKLEADMKYNEYKNKLIDDYYKTYNKAPEELDLSKIEESSSKVWSDVYKSNLALIWATNAVTFDNMFKSMRLSNKLFNTNLDGTFRTVGKGANTIVEAVEQTAFRKNLITPFKNYFKTMTVGSVSKGLIAKSMEGVQEVGQDIIGEGSSAYRSDLYFGGSRAEKAKQGGYFNALVENAKFNPETFASGFLMGSFAAPISFGTSLLNQYTIGNKVADLKMRFTNKEQWKENNKKINADLKRKAALLTELFQKSGGFIEHSKKPVVLQAKIQEQILDAAEKNDRKTFEDKKAESFRLGVQTMLESGLESEFIEHLEYMGKNLNAEELNQIFGRTDINESNKNIFANELLEKAEEIKYQKKLYDEVQERLINPFSKPTSQNDKHFYDYYAFEQLKREIVFNGKEIVDISKRMKNIMETSKIDTLTFSTLTDSKALSDKIVSLTLSIEASKDLSLNDEQKKILANDTKLLEKLKNYQDALSEYEKLKKSKTKNFAKLEKARNNLFIAYDDFMHPDSPVKPATTNDLSNLNDFLNNPLNTEDLEVFRENYLDRFPELIRGRSREGFNRVFDYLELAEEEKVLNKISLNLLDPTITSKVLADIKNDYKKITENQENHILDSLKAFTDKALTEQALTELLEEDLFIDMNEIDDLLNKGIMPTNFYNAITREKASKEEIKKAQDILEKLYTTLTGKSINYKRAYAQREKIKTDDRTVEDLLEQLEVKLDQEIDINEVLEKLKISPFLVSTERVLLNYLVDQKLGKIKFVAEAELPIEIKDGVVIVDIRNSAFEYKEGTVPFETLVISASVQSLTTTLLENENFKDNVEAVMANAKEALKDKIEDEELFSNPVLFMSEALNNLVFQKMLIQAEDVDNVDDTDLWSSLESSIKRILRVNKKLDNNLLKQIYSVLKLDTVVETTVEEETAPVEEEVEEETVEEVVTNEIETLNEELKALYEKRNALKEELDSLGKLQKRKKIKIGAELAKVNIEINNKTKALQELTNNTTPIVNEADEIEVPVDEITPLTSFKQLPEPLQKLLSKYLQKPISQITEDEYSEDIDAIRIISDYLAGVEEKDIVIPATFITEGTALQKLAVVFPEIEKYQLTEEEAKALLDKYNDTSRLVSFTIDDIEAYLYKKAIKQQPSKKKPTVTQEEQEKIDFDKAQRDENISLFAGKTITTVTYIDNNGNKKSVKLNPKDKAFLLKQHADILALPQDQFLAEYKKLLAKIKTAAYDISFMSLKTAKLGADVTDKYEQMRQEALQFIKDNASLANGTFITALNKRLNRYGAPFIFTRKGDGFVTTNRKQVVKKKKQKKLTRAEQIASETEVGSNVRGIVLKYLIQKKVKITTVELQKIFGDKRRVKKIAGEIRARLFMINNKSGLTLASISEALWAENQEQYDISNQDFLNALIDVIIEHNSYETMADELLTFQAEEQDDDYQEGYGDEFIAFMQAEQDAFVDFQAREEAITNKLRIQSIEAGTYTEGWEGIRNEMEALAYKKALEQGVYEEEQKTEAQEEDQLEQEDDFFSALEQKFSKLDTLAIELLDSIVIDTSSKNSTNYQITQGLMQKLTLNIDNFENLLAIVKASNSMRSGLTEKQKGYIHNRFVDIVRNPANFITFGNVPIKMNDGKIYTLQGVNEKDGKIMLFDDSNNLVTLSAEDLSLKADEVLLNAEEVLEEGVDLVAKDEENSYIKSTYSEIFSNLAESINEFDSLTEEDLLGKLSEHLTKCK